MQNKLFFIFTCIIFHSCFIQNDNDLIIKSSKTFLTKDGGHIDDEYGTLENFQAQNLKVVYLEDTIYAEAFQCVNACGDAMASIELTGDTIILKTKKQKLVSCASLKWYKYQYWIKNPDNKKFIVRQ